MKTWSQKVSKGFKKESRKLKIFKYLLKVLTLIMIAYLHKFKFYTSLRILVLSKQAKQNRIPSVLTFPKGPWGPKGVLWIPMGPGSRDFSTMPFSMARFDLVIV